MRSQRPHIKIVNPIISAVYNKRSNALIINNILAYEMCDRVDTGAGVMQCVNEADREL